jgi:extracellular factor (EF) 3-hydroxypalmitic acid methyl ester biosynthesis protein
MGTSNDAATSGLVTFETSQGVELRGTLHRLTRHKAVFECYSPEPVLRLSEVLSQFTLFLYDRPVYSGKAVVSNLIQSGPCTVCETALEEAWVDTGLSALPSDAPGLQASFNQFLENWGKSYRVLTDYKVVIADIHSFLVELRNWLDQLELNLRSTPNGSQADREREIMAGLTPGTNAAIGELYDRFDHVARTIEPDLVPVHQAFGRRQLQPLIQAAPFVYRTLQKPLGYAGDYEMVNMMMRDPCEGASLFGKAFNVCALNRPPIIAHRNRLRCLTDRLFEETMRNMARKKTATRFLDVGCGPAHEVRMFLREQQISDHTDFTLMDFDAETLDHTGRALTEIKQKHGRATRVHLVRQPVQQMLKQAAKAALGKSPDQQYDVVYCAGLFDYLTTPICRSLVAHFYDLVAPGGLLLVTNVDSNRSRNEMEYFLEWHLIYRDSNAMRALVPSRVLPENILVRSEPSGVNIFLEIRRPEA